MDKKKVEKCQKQLENVKKVEKWRKMKKNAPGPSQV